MQHSNQVGQFNGAPPNYTLLGPSVGYTEPYGAAETAPDHVRALPVVLV